MAQTMVNFRMDEDLKKDMDETCKAMGMTATTAYTIFAKKVTQEKRIPFEIVADPFYSARNMERLAKAIEDVKSGKATLKEHELIEAAERDGKTVLLPACPETNTGAADASSAAARTGDTLLFDEDLFLALLTERRKKSAAKEERDVVFDTAGTYGD